MALVSRRRFAGMVGLLAADGVMRMGWGQSHGAEHAAPPKPLVKPAASTVQAPPASVDRSVASPEEIWLDLMEGNKRFASGKPLAKDFIKARAATARGQHPYVIVLCCSDSRLSPELIFDQNIGDLFVVRTAGNVADPIALASLEYAVEHLGSRMIVVMGHEKCGAVSATLSGDTMPTDNLAALVAKIKPGIERLKGLVQGDSLMSLAVEANVHHSASNVVEASPIVRHEVASGKLSIVKAVYGLGTGEVLRLGGNIKEEK